MSCNRVLDASAVFVLAVLSFVLATGLAQEATAKPSSPQQEASVPSPLHAPKRGKLGSPHSSAPHANSLEANSLLPADQQSPGIFTVPLIYDAGGIFAASVAVADVSGDGKPDLLVANNCVSVSNCGSGSRVVERTRMEGKTCGAQPGEWSAKTESAFGVYAR